jgi:hypothetical protein
MSAASPPAPSSAGGAPPERPAAIAIPAADRIAAAGAAGRFVPHLRNRAIGAETARLTASPGGGLRLRADTRIAIPRLRLEQRVEAEFDARLRPAWCIVRAKVNSAPMHLEVEVNGGSATLRSRCDGRDRSVTRALEHSPLLLPDNAFAAHALAALAARAAPGGRFAALPACEPLAAEPGVFPVLLGGREFPPPAVRLRLTPDLDEHAWIEDGWVVRLMVPQAQMRVEWVPNPDTKGDRT